VYGQKACSEPSPRPGPLRALAHAWVERRVKPERPYARSWSSQHRPWRSPWFRARMPPLIASMTKPSIRDRWSAIRNKAGSHAAA